MNIYTSKKIPKIQLVNSASIPIPLKPLSLCQEQNQMMKELRVYACAIYPMKQSNIFAKNTFETHPFLNSKIFRAQKPYGHKLKGPISVLNGHYQP